MIKHYSFILIGVVLTSMFCLNTVVAQVHVPHESYWKWHVDGNFTFSGSAFSSEWTNLDGGNNGYTFNTFLNAFAHYKKDGFSINTSFLAQYTGQNALDGLRPVKTMDNISFLFMFGYKKPDYLKLKNDTPSSVPKADNLPIVIEETKSDSITSNTDEDIAHFTVASAFCFKSQLSETPSIPNPNNPDSSLTKFLSPGHFIFAPGFKYRHGSHNSEHQLFINMSPLTGHFVIVLDKEIADTQFDGKRFGVTLGASLIGSYRTRLSKDFSYQTTVELFSDYMNRPQYIDVSWNNIISAHIMKVIAINITVDLKYNYDQSSKARLASTFGIGLGYMWERARVIYPKGFIIRKIEVGKNMDGSI